MRIRLALVVLPSLLAVAAACSSSAENVDADESFATDEELAKRALQIVGVKQYAGGEGHACMACHGESRTKFQEWAESYTEAKRVLESRVASKKKIDQFRIDPFTPTSGYTPNKLGFLAAGVHLPDHPLTKKLGDTFVTAFGATKGPDEFRKLREAARMPIRPDHDRLTKREFATLLQWVDKGMPKLKELMPEAGRPVACEPLYTDELKAHIKQMQEKGWAARNLEQGMPMFACTDKDPTHCFTQQLGGKDVFAKSDTLEVSRSWAMPGTTVRVIAEMPVGTSFWTRNSADGRFAASGREGEVPEGIEGSAFFVDFAPLLKGEKLRLIGANASYDPSFFPDNSGFLFQGGGSHYCTQNILTKANTKNVQFTEAECSSLENVGLYQSVGRRLGDNELSDHFIVNNSFESDDGYGRDTTPSFGEEEKATIRVMISTGSDGYKIGQNVSLPMPWEGDTMMSPTTTMLASRISGETGQLGYSLRKLTATPGATGYTMEAKPIGRVCIPGNKAQFSFDERYLVTHHYLAREDFPSDEAFAPYKEKAAADIYVVDLLTGEKITVTHSKAGQLALFPHFRSDGWLYFIVKDRDSGKEYMAVSDVILKRPR